MLLKVSWKQIIYPNPHFILQCSMQGSTEGRLPPKVVFHQRFSSTKGHLPPVSVSNFETKIPKSHSQSQNLIPRGESLILILKIWNLFPRSQSQLLRLSSISLNVKNLVSHIPDCQHITTCYWTWLALYSNTRHSKAPLVILSYPKSHPTTPKHQLAINIHQLWMINYKLDYYYFGWVGVEIIMIKSL